MAESIIFLTGLSLMFIHEMDAIRCKEWRIFPGLSILGDKTGRNVFLFAHIPIFFWLFSQLINSSDINTFRIGFDIFLIIHLGLHILFLKHKNNEFTDWISWTVIIGSGISGLLDLILILGQ